MNKRSVFGIIFFVIVISFLLAALAVDASAYEVGDMVDIVCDRCHEIVGQADVQDSYQISDILSYCSNHQTSHESSGWSYDPLEYDHYTLKRISCREPLDATNFSVSGSIYIELRNLFIEFL